MALINCPECGHQVSDSAATCPNCGVAIKKEEVPKTKIGELEKNYFLGVIFVVAGIFGLLVSIPLIPVIIGIFFAAGSFLCIGAGILFISGQHECTCPFCGSSGQLPKGNMSHKCRKCGRTSFVKDGYLQP